MYIYNDWVTQGAQCKIQVNLLTLYLKEWLSIVYCISEPPIELQIFWVSLVINKNILVYILHAFFLLDNLFVECITKSSITWISAGFWQVAQIFPALLPPKIYDLKKKSNFNLNALYTKQKIPVLLLKSKNSYDLELLHRYFAFLRFFCW